MKKELTLQPGCYAAPTAAVRMAGHLRLMLSRLVLRSRWLAAASRLFSRVMDQPIGPSDTLRILHVQLAAACLLLPCAMAALLRLLFLAWLALALWQCRHMK
ncbi:MAG: hypothetical protein ILA34_07355 [Bacteroidaceae bacterium]|nr:hypothetical protein [Bacteroidaceae bacterium]